MSKLHSALLAIALTGATVAACGDDEDSNTPGDTTDGGGPTEDGGTKDGGGSTGSDAGDAGTGTGGDGAVEPPPPADKCPDHPNVEDDGEFCVITGNISNPITEDLDLSNVTDRKILLSGAVFVGEDVGAGDGCGDDSSAKTVTLKIAAGTEVLAETSETFLLIQRGSRIEAQGTKDAPIVFTTALPDKAPGSWGGLLINGRAPHNSGCDVEGEAGTGSYSGDKEDDDSGVVSYVRIEWGGAQLTPEAEYNGLTLSGVGSGTQIDHVHVHGCADDGFEFFGGTVNAKYLVSTANGDDGLDWTSGYRGKIQFAVVQQYDVTSSNDPRGIEGDNVRDNESTTPISYPVLSNITLIGADVSNGPGAAYGMMLRTGMHGELHNVLAMNFLAGCINVDGVASQAAVESGDLVMKNSRVLCTEGAGNFVVEPAEALFSAENGNEVLESIDVLENALAQDSSANFAPKAGSGLLTGGEAPSDAFFEAADFIGAIGEDDWTKDGSWVNIP